MDRARELELELELRNRQQQTASMEHQESITPRPPRQPSSIADFVGGIGQGLQNFGYGATQRMMELTGNPRAQFMRQALENERSRADLESQLKGAPSIARSAGEFVTDAAIPTAMGIAAGPSLPAATGIGALSGYLRPSASAQETASNATLEGILGFGTALGTRAVMPRLNAEPEHIAAIKAGARKGMPYTGGQIADNPIVQRAEAHAQWNPLAKWHAIPLERSQDDAFVTGLLKEVGVDPKAIPKNPSLNADTLNAASRAIGNRFQQVFPDNTSFDIGNRAAPDLWRQLHALRPNNLNLLEEDRRIVSDAARQVRQIIYNNNGRVPAPLMQDTIELVSEAQSRLTTEGKKKAGDALSKLYDELVNVLPDKAKYEAAKADWARLLTIEDLLRKSSGMGEGIPDRKKLAAAVERGLPGGILRDRSTMADLARGGQKSVGVGALPDRATGLPIPSDIPNAATYWRWNNPAARWGLMNPNQRDMIETLIRYLPGTATRKESEDIYGR